MSSSSELLPSATGLSSPAPAAVAGETAGGLGLGFGFALGFSAGRWGIRCNLRDLRGGTAPRVPLLRSHTPRRCRRSEQPMVAVAARPFNANRRMLGIMGETENHEG